MVFVIKYTLNNISKYVIVAKVPKRSAEVGSGIWDTPVYPQDDTVI